GGLSGCAPSSAESTPRRALRHRRRAARRRSPGDPGRPPRAPIAYRSTAALLLVAVEGVVLAVEDAVTVLAGSLEQRVELGGGELAVVIGVPLLRERRHVAVEVLVVIVP